MATDLNSSSPISVDKLKEDGKVELLDILESLRGRKCLVLDVLIGGLLNHIIPEGSKMLKENGVQYFRELKGELGDFVSDSGRDIPDHIVYLTRPSIAHMKIIARQVQACMKAGIRSQYHVFFMPHRSVACEQMLEDEGVLEVINIGEYHLGLVPFDTDILSLEISDLYKQCYVDGDSSQLAAVSRALHKIQTIYGTIPNIKSKGAASRKVLQKLLRLRREEFDCHTRPTDGDVLGSQPAIDTLVLIDREVDLFSALLTPLTYEGLVDEILGIDNGRVKVDASVLGDEKDQLNIPAMPGMSKQQQAQVMAATAVSEPKRVPGEKVSLPMHSSDMIFSEIRDLSIEALGPFLQEKAIMIRKRYADFRDNKDASISEIHDFVKKIPQLTKEYKALNQHINIAELIKRTTDSPEFREHWQTERGILEGEMYTDQVEDLIATDTERANFFKALRLLCLISLTGGGIKASKYDTIRRLLVHTYGYEHLFTLANLEKAGLLKRKESVLLDTSSSASSPTWITLRKHLRLINERVNVARPDDIAYVTAGYAPLLVRLVQSIVSPGWAAVSSGEAMKLLPGPMLEFSQSVTVAEELDEVLARSKGTAAAEASASGEAATSPGALPFLPEDDMGATGPAGSRKKVMLVFVTGGLTFLEIAAMRYLSGDPTFPYTILMATTAIVNGNSLLESLSYEF